MTKRLCRRCGERWARWAGELCTKCHEDGGAAATTAADPVEDIRRRDTTAGLRATIRSLEVALRDAEARADFLEALRERTTVAGAEVRRRARKAGTREGAPCAVISDVHLGEVVEPERVSGLNCYNLKIARLRVERFFEGFAWLARHVGAMFDVHEALLAILGDIITGYLREEAIESAECSPIHAVRHGYGLISTGIDFLLEELPGVECLTVICVHGNHGRTRDKPSASTGSDNSFEHLMYLFLSDHFADNERVRFVVAKGEHVIVPVYGRDTRWMHGDGVRYEGGIGGLTIPLNKALSRLNKGKPCHLTGMGHHHTYLDAGAGLVNGSVVGYTPYAQKLGFEFEPPRQAFCVIDSERGRCLTTPIWLDTADERRLWT